jgi:hypothetical protein
VERTPTRSTPAVLAGGSGRRASDRWQIELFFKAIWGWKRLARSKARLALEKTRLAAEPFICYNEGK